MSAISLKHSDCLEVMKDIPDKTIDMIEVHFIISIQLVLLKIGVKLIKEEISLSTMIKLTGLLQIHLIQY